MHLTLLKKGAETGTRRMLAGSPSALSERLSSRASGEPGMKGDCFLSTVAEAPVMAGQRVITPVDGAGALNRVTLHLGPDAILEGFEGIAKQSKRELFGEFFHMTRPNVIKALRHAAKKGVHTEVLMDAEMMSLGNFHNRDWKQKGLELIAFPEKPRKLHSKALVGDSRALVATGYPHSDEPYNNVDFGVAFDGPATQALKQVMQANRSGDKARVQLAAAEALRQGVLFNDRSQGVRVLTNQLESMIDSAQREILIGTKDLSDDILFGRLYQTRQRGVKIRVVTGRESPFAGNRGLDITRSPYLHGNAMVVDGELAYVGSAFFHSRPMARFSDRVMSNETGVLIRDRSAISTLVATITKLADEAATQRHPKQVKHGV